MGFLIEHGLLLVYWVFAAFVSVFYPPKSAYWMRWRWATIALGAGGVVTLATAVTCHLLVDQITILNTVLFLVGYVLLTAYWVAGIVYYLFHKEVSLSSAGGNELSRQGAKAQREERN